MRHALGQAGSGGLLGQLHLAGGTAVRRGRGWAGTLKTSNFRLGGISSVWWSGRVCWLVMLVQSFGGGDATVVVPADVVLPGL